MATQEREPERQPHAGRRVALFPLPFQGHLSPMLQLADLLRARARRHRPPHALQRARPGAPPPRARTSPSSPSTRRRSREPPPLAPTSSRSSSRSTPPARPVPDALASLLPGVACAVVDGSGTRRWARQPSASPRSRSGRTAPPRSAACSPSAAARRRIHPNPRQERMNSSLNLGGELR